MTIFDDQVELYVTNTKPGLLTVWSLNPDQTSSKLYGVPYSTMAEPVKTSVRSWLGTPAAPPPPSYGELGKIYQIRCENRNGGDPNLYQQFGPIRNIRYADQGYLPNKQFWNIQTDGSVSATNGAAQESTAGNIGVFGVQGTPPDLRFIDVVTGQQVQPGATQGGYPALSPANVALLDAFLEGLRILTTPPLLAAGAAIAQLGGQVQDVRQRTINLEPKIEETRTGVGELGIPLAEVQLGNAAILLKLEDILDCTCRLVVEDCAGDDRVGMKEALKVIIGVVCELQKKLGYSPGKITVPGNPDRDLLTVREALSDIMRRTGFNNPVNTFQCDESVVLNNLEQAVQLVQGTLGYGVGVNSGRTNEDGEPITICNVSATFDEVLKRPSDVHYIDGYERFDSPYPLLKIVFSAEDTYRHDHQITLAGVTLPPEKAAILALVDPYRIGDWLCRVYLATNRKLEGWYEDKETGWAHLKKLAGLSSLPLRLGEDTAIFQPANAPIKWRNRDLYPRVAYWSDSQPNGLSPATIGLR